MADEAEESPLKRLEQRAALEYLGHAFDPMDLLDFIELPVFSRRWSSLDLDVETDLAALQMMIMLDPKGGPVIKGTHGLRKIRFAPARWGTGKSGAARCLYVYFEEFGIVLLCVVYGKSEMGTISDEAKKAINKLIEQVESELARRKSQ